MKRSFAIIMVLISLIISAGCSNSNTVKNTAKESTQASTANVVKTPYTVHGVPVLMYHSIAVEKGNPIRMPVEQFDKEMKYIKDQGYTTLTLKELYDYFENKVPVPAKSVVITLDDGYEDNYTAAFPVLKKYGLKATIFMITCTIDADPKCLTSAQLKEMDKAGIEIESHTVTHTDLDTLNYSQQLAELKNSKAALEKLLGRSVDYVAYPEGRYNNDTVKAVAAAGYKMAFTTNGRWSDKSDGILTLDRVYISTFHSMDVFKDRLTNPNYPVN
jgi:peptidoglycan/xylan/chitin deacetylase (PgdA/CDA1 family)